jgi:long-chain acyl-CoA synthetase
MSKIHTIVPGFYGVGSVEISPPPSAGESGVRRLAKTKDTLITQPTDGIETAYDIVSHAAHTHGNRNAFGWRDVVDIIEEEKEVKKVVDGQEVVEKKKWKYFELSDYKYMSYLDVKTGVSEIGRGLINLGLSKGDVFNVYAQTR